MQALLDRLLVIAQRFPREYCPKHHALLQALRQAISQKASADAFSMHWISFATNILTTPQWVEFLLPAEIATAELVANVRRLANTKFLPPPNQPGNDLTTWINQNIDPINRDSVMWRLVDYLADGDPRSGGHFEFLGRFYLFKDLLIAQLVDEQLKPIQQAIFSQYYLQRHNWRNGYAADYPYQGMSKLGISGCKPCEERLARYAIDEYLSDTDQLLDIGSNNGFLTLALAEKVGYATGIEYNPYLVATAEIARDFLGIQNAKFIVGDFVEFDTTQQFDVVLSLANHCTIDGNLSIEFEIYIAKIFSLLKPGGYLFFESHNVFGPGAGSAGDDGDLDKKFDVVERYFEVIKHKMTQSYVPWGDVDKLFVVLRRRSAYWPDSQRTFDLAHARTSYSYETCKPLPMNASIAEHNGSTEMMQPNNDHSPTEPATLTSGEEVAARSSSTEFQEQRGLDAEQDTIDQAVAMINDGRLEEALGLLSNLVIEGSPRWEVYHLLGLLFEHSGTPDLALRHLQTAATLEGSGSNALRDLVRLFVSQKEYGKAIGCLAQIVQRDGADETLINVVAQLLAEMPASHTDLGWLSPEIPALQKLASSFSNSCTPPMSLTGEAAMPRPSQPNLPVTDRRLAFLVHNKELLNHYRSVCQLLPPTSFVFLIHAEDSEAAAIAEAIHQEGWATLTTSEVLDNKQFFRALVSNHPLTIEEPPLIKRLADTNVRFMYAAGKSGWNLSDWNRLYDVILCYGPYHADRFLQSTEAHVIQMGYPRFDPIFAPGFDPVSTARQFGCDPGRKTVVWLPTWSSLSSVGIFDKGIAALCSDFNVVVKVHPLMAAEEPEKVDALEQFGFARVIRDATDNMPLYRIADYVLCDYGGPAFGAIYADRNLLLLDVAEAEKDELLQGDSPELMIREHIVHVDSRQNTVLADLLADEGLWAAQARHRAALRRLFFAPYFGYASRIAADILSNLDSINQRRMQS